MNKLYFLLIIALTINIYPVSQNWYVSNSSKGNGSGTSWLNAADYSKFGSATPQPGDTVFFDGGTDSLVYSESNYNSNTNIAMMITTNGTSTLPIVFTRGKDAGHNGIPIIAVPNRTQIYMSGADYVEISYLKFIPNSEETSYNFGVAVYDNSSYVDVLYNEFDYTRGRGVSVSTGSYNTLSYNNFYTETIYADSVTNSDVLFRQEDAIKGIASSELTISYNTITNSSTIKYYPTGLGYSGSLPHRDFIQVPQMNPDNGTTYIHNNFIGGFFADSVRTHMNTFKANDTRGTYLIYNNVVAVHHAGSDLSFDTPSGTTSEILNVYVYNNTFIYEDNANFNYDDVYFINDGLTEFKFKNNIWYSEGYYPGSIADVTNEIDYNVYELGSDNYWGSNDWATWTGLGYDANSLNTGVTFVENDLSVLSTTPADYKLATGSNGIDDGTSLSSIFTTDYRDTVRSDTWDVGAFEYFENSSSNINLRGKLLLQGPFNSNSMMTNLGQNGLLPTTQPFNSAPWNYGGSESLGSGSSSSYVDWVLVELRNSSNPTQVKARSAAILKNDGTLLNTDGNAGVPFNNVQEGSYYIAVYHRNHLAVMSASPVQLAVNSQLYDFTTGINKAYGTNSMADLGNGKYGMYAGDGNSNGGITIADRNEVWLPQNGTLGYLNGDFNLDGGVTIHDVNLYWNINNGTMTQVP